MAAARVTLLLLAAVVGAAGLAVNTDAQSSKERPVTKVINLLKDMKTELEKEAEKDQELFENFQCWCTTYGAEKTKAISIAEQSIADLTAAIEEYTAKIAQLETDIERLTGEIAEQEKALEEAAGIRSKENSEFSASEVDLSASIKGLGGAVTALGKAHGGALDQESMLQVQHLLKRHMAQHRFTGRQHSTVMSFLQQPVAAKSYTAQSGAIFGILKQMKETFESNLDTQRSDEKQAVDDYSSLKDSKNKGIQSAKDQIDSSTAELADSKMKLSESKKSLEDTRVALDSDTTFLADLKTKCAGMDKAWEARSKMRADETTAVQETINILDGDEAHDTFSKSLGFFQKTSKAGVRSRAAALIAKTGLKFGNPKMAMLSLSVKSDVFDKVKKNIENLAENLKIEQEEETKERDFCIKEINENESQQTAAANKKEDLEQKIEDLKQSSQWATDAIAQAKKEIFETHVAMKQASGNRLAENKEFQTTVADQRATQGILKKALVRLEAFYKAKAAALLQQHQEPGAAAPAAPAGFGEYKKAGGSEGAMGLLKSIIKESAVTEKQAIEDENEAQADYETFQKDSFKSINALSAEIVDNTEKLAKNDGKLTVAESDLASNQEDIYNLRDYNRELHGRCDYLLDNYAVRQSSRAEEINSLNDAKAMFSGAKLGF